MSAADRKGRIGGSDIAGIVGLSPWASPWSVWVDTVGLLDKAEPTNRERLDVGTDAESFLRAQFERHHPGLQIVGEQHALTTSAYAWASGHCDGVVAEGDEVLGIWEAKTDNSLRPWDEVPAYYLCQIQWYMWLADLPRAWVTVGFAGWTVRTYEVERDDADIELIVAAAVRFWDDHVLTGTPPPVDDHPATGPAIAAHHRDANPDAVLDAGDDLAALVAELDGLKAHMNADKRRRAALENAIKAALGERTELHRDGDLVASWRPQRDTRVDIDAVRAERGTQFDVTKTIRVLRTHQPKEPTS